MQFVDHLVSGFYQKCLLEGSCFAFQHLSKKNWEFDSKCTFFSILNIDGRKLTFSIVISSTAASISFFSSKREFFCCSTLRKMGKRWETFVAAHTQKNLIFADFFSERPSLFHQNHSCKSKDFFFIFQWTKTPWKIRPQWSIKMVPHLRVKQIALLCIHLNLIKLLIVFKNEKNHFFAEILTI